MSTNAQHTPGKWAVYDHYCGRDPKTAGEEYARTRLIGLGPFDTIAEVRQGSDDVPGDVDANARLIAAAPELLEALEWIERVCCEELPLEYNDAMRKTFQRNVRDAANKAIALATGEPK